ncbi:hypothetical protein FACS189499_07360 [Clostridia bacterium]|nr:hypothetical protein FACS189499_07360 [Clostridia bacterium]
MQIMTDIVKEKLRTRPSEITTFRPNEWEIEGIRELANKNDLSNNFIKDKTGEYHCVYKIKNKKAFDMLKIKFLDVHNDVKNNTEIYKESGYTVIN